jgi:hypothetical protein
MSKKEITLASCKVAGYHNDMKSFTRVYVESRLSLVVAQEAYNQGIKLRESGMKCTCSKCKEAE